MKRRAFTLMEMLVALAIIGLLLAGSFIAASTLNQERALRTPLNELRIMAKKAWARSMEEQRAWQIRLMQDRFVLEPRQAVNADDQRYFQTTDQQMGRSTGIQSYVLEPGIRMEVRHWGEAKWHPPMPDSWVFEHSGLCEPINIRFISETASVTASFDPLTAAALDEMFEFVGEQKQ
ncbi:MAG: Prepilin-type N-terminal cleavage/methylation protein [Verrucomicrobiales bacterium]|nr:Prepilin-type N-terminal cleavage/methylation protein [Verrucomicrobiales bacterium]